MESRELLGYWWASARPDRKVPGLLRTFGHGEVELALNGTLDDWPAVQTMPDYSRIHGITRNGQQVTLDGCITRHLSVNVGGGYVAQTLHVGTCFIGAQFGNSEDRFNIVELRLRHLQDWMHMTGIRAASPPRLEVGEVGPTIWFVVPDPMGARQGDSLRFEVLTDIGVELSGGRGSLAEDMYLKATLAEPSTLHQVTELVLSPLRDLVSLALDRAAAYHSVILHSPAK